jgi:hypothetical protein
MMTKPYPDPPWQTYGRAFFAPYVVSAHTLSLPPGLEPLQAFGVATGLLGYVEYHAPSPLTYRELIWMPCLVSTTAGGRRARGYFVARMYVDHEGSLAGGREIWALPKTMAMFQAHDRGVDVSAEDGTRIALSFKPRGFGMRVRNKMATLQRRDDGTILRFQANCGAKVSPAAFRLERFSSSHEGWRSFEGARQMPGLAVALQDFESTMQPPQILCGA